ncbi:carboxypeptidase-like regulatory domain-containing protein [Lignipirellula cremea]|uniref:Carboxypeptidase regulatory-like domain-containing protein n=1 Tax=Lignipirellula cremea TaxID=2528010 RepID=A0A518DRV3_9BACT|nr:carboxypeptidase-like regulatory domain-containing protein [Lignipirellula cremea]QDU94577.1 hypothetical protein Pla8534_23700 [Lignipirellula cremea]
MLTRTLGVAAAILLAGFASAGQAADAVKIHDVALRDGGVLVGQVVTTTGAPVKDAQLQLVQQGKTVVALKTNNNGQFGVKGLRSGVYQVSTAQSSQQVRVWAPGAQPPTAKSTMMVVEDQNVIRAQGGGMSLQSKLLHGTAIGLGAGGLAVALSDDDDPAPKPGTP